MENKPRPEAIELNVELIGGEDIYREDIDDMTRRLRSELEEVSGAEQVRLATTGGQAAEGAKAGAEAIALGALLVSVLPTAVPAIIGYIKEWTLRPGNRSVKIKAQIEQRSVEVEFDPREMSEDEMMTFISEIQARLEPKAKE